jgi:Skp family chaperone for outer membrane proteins
MSYRTPVLMAFLLLGLCAVPARGQEAASPIRVATVVPARIFVQLEETAAQQQRLNARRRTFEAEQQQRAERLEELRLARDQLRSGHDQWEQRHQELMQAMAEFQTWANMQQLEAQRMQKQQMTGLFDKIQQGIAEVSRQRGIHLVIAEPDIPHIDMVNPDELRMLLNQRNVLYAADQVDITDDVVTHMNEQYRAGR